MLLMRLKQVGPLRVAQQPGLNAVLRVQASSCTGFQRGVLVAGSGRSHAPLDAPAQRMQTGGH